MYAEPVEPVKDALNASVDMYRVYEEDAISFQKQFRMDFDIPWDPERLKPFVYLSVAFPYLDKPEGANPSLPGREELLCSYRIPDRDHQDPVAPNSPPRELP